MTRSPLFEITALYYTSPHLTSDKPLQCGIGSLGGSPIYEILKLDPSSTLYLRALPFLDSGLHPLSVSHRNVENVALALCLIFWPPMPRICGPVGIVLLIAAARILIGNYSIFHMLIYFALQALMQWYG